ncbi:MAG: glycosyltransferase family 4 protein [Chloroflexota bacterium]|nr:glycosyltransferase family 1 protein [Lentimicrobium sp.]
MKRQTIALISEHASPLAQPGSIDAGGQNVYVRELAMELEKLEFNIDIFTRKDSDDLPTITEWIPNVRIIHVDAGPAWYIPKEQLLPFMDDFSNFMIDFINRYNIEYRLVHANFFMSGMVAMRLKDVLKIPFMITFHALGIVRALHQKEADKFPKERIFLEKKIIDKADKIIAECPQDADDMINLYNADPGKMEIIPCGFNPDEFNPVDRLQARQHIGVNPDDRIILSIGRIVPRKGVDNIIRSLRFLKKRFSNIRLIIVGGDADEHNGPSSAEVKRLKDLAISYKVADKVTFAGPKQPLELKYYYSAADIFISTPWYEPFGITPLESMACGTPVIGSDVGGIKYTVKDGETGFLVPPRKPLQLARRVIFVLNNRMLLQHMRFASIRRVNALFTWKRVASDMRQAYFDTIMSGMIPSFMPSGQIFKPVEPEKNFEILKNKDVKVQIYRNN